MSLILERLKRTVELISEHSRIIGEQELLVVQDVHHEGKLEERLKELKNYSEVLNRKHKFLQTMLRDLQVRMDRHHSVAEGHNTESSNTSRRDRSSTDASQPGNELGDEPHVWGPTIAEHVSDFNNRFIVHNAQIKWNNPLRNILLRYVHQVSQRRGFVYYTTRRAVKFILDIIEEQRRTKTSAFTSAKDSHPQTPNSPFSEDDELNLKDRIEQILKDGQDFVTADDPEDGDAGRKGLGEVDQADKDVSQEFLTNNSYHLRLVAPQIQLQKREKSQSGCSAHCARHATQSLPDHGQRSRIRRRQRSHSDKICCRNGQYPIFRHSKTTAGAGILAYIYWKLLRCCFWVFMAAMGSDGGYVRL